MSGHSKWSKVKHQKASTDAAKSAAFTRAVKAIMVAVKEGGGITDPDKNFRLRLAMDKARSVNMPNANIKRAIDKGTGGEVNLVSPIYEAFGPENVAIMVEAVTDNPNRTVSQIKNLIEKNGGRMVAPGAVSYMFKYMGVIVLPKKDINYDTIWEWALESGASDTQETNDYYELYTQPSQLNQVKGYLEGKGVEIDNAQLVYIPVTSVRVTTGGSERLQRLLEKLDENEDVSRVFSNESVEN